MNIYLDIETIPSQNPAFLAKVKAECEFDMKRELLEVRPPANIKDQAKIDAWNENERPVKEAVIRANCAAAIEEKYRATSFDGALGHIAVIGYAIDDKEPVTIYADPINPTMEAALLYRFFAELAPHYDPSRQTKPVFIGHNLVNFDLRFIFQRCVVLGVRPPSFIPFSAKPWDETVFDTMTKWAGDRNRVSMSKLCDALGLPAKGDELGEEVDGSMVWDMVRDGRIADVATYCAGDITRTRDIHKRLTFVNAPYPPAVETFFMEGE